MMFKKKKSKAGGSNSSNQNIFEKLTGEDFSVPSECLLDPIWQKHNITLQNILDKMSAKNVDPGDFSELWEMIIFMGDIDMIKEYFSPDKVITTRYASPLQKTALEQVNRMGWTPLCYAAWGGSKVAVSFLLEMKAKEQYTEVAPQDVLQFAQQGADAEIISLLADEFPKPTGQKTLV